MRIFLSLVLAASLFVGWAPGADTYGKVGDFSLVDSQGKPFDSSQLQGKTWIASFVFTRCTGPCPQVTATMARLQKELEDIPDLVLVTFTVDPSRDTPDELRRYAENYRAKPDRWVFLTGAEESIHQLMTKKFLLGVKRADNPKPGQEFDHATRLVLVDSSGSIVGYFPGVVDKSPENREAEAEFEKGLARLKSLVKNGPKAKGNEMPWYYPSPGLNACLNGLAGVLLVLAFLAIKARQPKVHGALMASALVTSAVFLASYLIYHLFIKEGIATRFADMAPNAPAAMAYLYYGILVSHTILAIAVTPMALTSAWFASKQAWVRHKALAKLTFPLWLYVSVTGVMVYWMLYHLPVQAGWNGP